MGNISGLRISASETQIVAGSRALHHVLPELVPPIDREHTIQFFYGYKRPYPGPAEFRTIVSQLQAKVMPRTPESVVFSETLEAAPSEVTEAVRAQGLEGVVAKRRNSLYEPRRRIRDRTRRLRSLLLSAKFQCRAQRKLSPPKGQMW